MIKMLDEESSLEFLAQRELARLGCILETGEPYVVPVNYVFADGEMYVHSQPGEKTSAIEINPKVCLQVDEIKDRGLDWKSVIVFGEFKKVSNKNKKTEILYKFYKKFPRFTPVEAKFSQGNSVTNTLVFKLRIERLTGVIETHRK